MYVPLILTLIILQIQCAYVLYQGQPLHSDLYRISATASLNLAGETRLWDFYENVTLTARQPHQCMSAFASVTPDCQIRVSSMSNSCGIINTPFSSGLWQDKVWFDDSLDGPNAPLNFIFHLSGSQTIQHNRFSNSLAIASSQISIKVSVDTAEKSVMSHIVYQYGKPDSNSQHNVELGDAYAIVTLILYVSRFEKYQLLGSTFVKLYSIAKNNEQQLDTDILNILDGRSSIVEWKSSATKLTSATGQILRILKILPLPRDIPPTVVVGSLSFDVEFRFHANKTISIKAGAGKSYIVKVYMTTQASSSADSDASATTDFSNTLKLSAITIPKSYRRQRNSFDVAKMYATFSSFSMPITEE